MIHQVNHSVRGAWFLFTRVLSGKKIEPGAAGRTGGESRRALSVLYASLGAFTHFYGASLALLFFTKSHALYPVFINVLDAFEEPYLGSLGIYVVLKEISKRSGAGGRTRHGEYFVLAWGLLLIASTAYTVFLPAYEFNLVYKLILTNGIATIMIYIGSVIHPVTRRQGPGSNEGTSVEREAFSSSGGRGNGVHR